MLTPQTMHYVSIAGIIGFSALGGCIGQGIAGMGSIRSMTRQPDSYNEIFRAMFIGLVLIESGPIVALVSSLMLLFKQAPTSWGTAWAEVGIALAISATCCVMSIASGTVVRAATYSISRQPFSVKNIFTLMIMAQAIIEAPAIFAFIVSVLIHSSITTDLNLALGLKYFASCLVLAIGSIGPSIGQAIFSSAACSAAGLRNNIQDKLFPFMLINQTLIDTPLIFCLLFSFLILFTQLPIENSFGTSISFIAAAAAMGSGTLGSGIGIGYTGAQCAYQIAHNPQQYRLIFKTNLFSIAFIESSTIYAMIIALLLFINGI